MKKSNQNGLSTVFHYGPNGELLWEKDQAGNTKAYVWLDGRPLARIDNDAQIYYYHVDHLGTQQAMTDAAGATVWKADYEPFGKATVKVSTVENNLRFPGQYYDRETGLHYNYFRDYDPGTGRYVEADPIGLAGGMNLYAYANQNPLSYTDPTGENPLVGALIGAVGDIGIQVMFNGMRPQCIKWDVVAIAALAGAVNPFSGLNATNSALKAERQFARAAGLREGGRAATRAAQRGDRHNSRSMKEAASWASVEGGAEGAGNLIPDDWHVRIGNQCECR